MSFLSTLFVTLFWPPVKTTKNTEYTHYHNITYTSTVDFCQIYFIVHSLQSAKAPVNFG